MNIEVFLRQARLGVLAPDQGASRGDEQDVREAERGLSYVKQILAPNEKIRAVARFHWVSWLRAWAALVVLGIILVGVWIFVGTSIRLLTTEIALTDRRLILKTGLLERHARELRLHAIETVEVNQTVFGRLLGYGTVTVHGTGDEMWATPNIAQPLKFRREIAIVAAENGARMSQADAA